MTKLKTEQSLLDALRRAASHEPTGDEMHKQRVSFIMGTMKRSSSVTRAKVEEVVAGDEGKK